MSEVPASSRVWFGQDSSVARDVGLATISIVHPDKMTAAQALELAELLQSAASSLAGCG